MDSLDPVLVAHAVRSDLFCYDVGSFVPLSIRDQMIRSILVVRRAVEHGIIMGDTRPLLVVGAGAAGVTAAIEAAAHGVRTVLVERTDQAFTRQAHCRTRHIDPTLYDWALHHWPEGAFPWTEHAVPLKWEAGPANRVAAGWRQQFAAELNSLGSLLEIHYLSDVAFPQGQPVLDQSKLMQVTITGPGRVSRTEAFGALISSVGIGTERTTAGDYAGYRFWDTDPFQRPNLGLRGHVQPKVLISGGGDGALQDCIRILTGRSAREVLDTLLAVGPVKTVVAGLERTLQSEEDQAQRCLAWGRSPRHDHPVHTRLEGCINAFIADVRRSRVWKSICASLKAIVRDAPVDVTVAHDCGHFSRSYPLNRFLVLLIAAYLDEVHRSGTSHLNTKVRFHQNTRVNSVTGIGHLCGAQGSGARGCHGKEHSVTFRHFTCNDPALHGVTGAETFNIVILRHGVDPPARVLGTVPVSNPRQMLPYHLPF